MAEANEAATSSKAFDLETLAKSIALSTVVLFMIGVLTNNLYLLYLGFSDFSLIKTRYVLTGFLVVFLAFLWNLCFVYGDDILRHKQTEKFNPSNSPIYLLYRLILRSIKSLHLRQVYLRVIKPSYLRHIISRLAKIPDWCLGLSWIVLPLIISFLFIYDSFSRVFQNFAYTLFITFIYSSIFYLVCLIVGFILPKMLREEFLIFDETESKAKRDIKVGNYAAASIIYIFFILIYITMFVLYFYPHIPEQLGGGQVRKVQIVFAKDQVEIVKQLDIPTCPTGKVQGNLSKPLFLLFEGSENYFLRMEDGGRLLKINKKAVIGEIPLLNNPNKNQKVSECPLINSHDEKLKTS